MKHKENIYKKFGYLEYIDERGLTLKSQKSKNKILMLHHFPHEMLRDLGIVFCTNTATIVSDSKFSELQNIIDTTLENTKQIQFPFAEELLIRTSNFTKINEFSMPNPQIPVRKTQEMVKDIMQIFSEIRPDQILLHSRLSLEHLKTIMIAARFKKYGNKLEAEIGEGGIRDIYQLDDAHIVSKASLESDFHFHFVKTKPGTEKIENYKKILFGANIIIPYIEELMFDQHSRDKEMIHEFRINPFNDKLYMIFNDTEIL